MAENPPELAHQHIIEPGSNDIDCRINIRRPLTNAAGTLLGNHHSRDSKKSTRRGTIWGDFELVKVDCRQQDWSKYST